MPHPSFVEPSTGKIAPLTLGTGTSAVTVGGAATLPFCSFDGDTGHPPAVALEIADIPPSPIPPAIAEAFGETLADPLERLSRGLSLCTPDVILLRLSGSHPDALGSSPEDAARLVERVATASGLPLIVVGSGHLEADVALFKEVAEVLRGTGSLIGKAQERNYRSLAAIAQAAGLPLIALTDLDVNLCKQLNILLTQAGFPRERIVIDPMASAVGYGFEYTYSVMERIRLAALRQGDEVLRCPVLLDLGEVVGKVKEVHAPESETPGWGPATDRHLANEALAAAAYLLAGADIVSVRDPRTVTAVKAHRDLLIGGER
jgi:acetyl-CoA decarbonylase/synthase complex subunit delta